MPPLYLTVSTIIFSALPLFLLLSIYIAKRGAIKLHIISQLSIFAIMLLSVAVFEIGIRLDGSFLNYVESNSPYFTLFILYLAIHILIAVATVVYWSIFLYRSLKSYKEYGKDAPFFMQHKRLGYRLFAAITLTALMGLSIFLYLFYI